MSKIFKRLELVANVCIIILSLFAAAALVRYVFFSDRPANQPKKGQKVALQNIDWAQNGRTLVLVLQKDCRFCSESAPFYKTLVSEANKGNRVQLVAVFPHPIEEGGKYLGDLGVSISEVRQEKLRTLTVAGTPTLMLVDNTGAIIEIWVGKLTPKEETELLNLF